MVCACVRLVKKHQDQEAPSILIFESEALEENFSVIKAEYEAYRQKLANRKDWDDSDTTPGLGPRIQVHSSKCGRFGLGWFVYLLQMKHSIA